MSGPPDALAAAGPDRQPVGIVYLRPPVERRAAIVLAVPEHRRQRRDAEPLDVAPKEQCGLDVLDHAVLAVAGDPVGAGDARALEKCVGDQPPGAAWLQPEAREAGKLLGAGRGGVDRDAARGQPELVERPGGAEIGCAEEGHPVALLILVHDSEARETRVRELPRGMVVLHVEIVAGELDLTRLAVLHHMDAHGLLEEPPWMEETHGRGVGRVGPERVVRIVGYPVVLVIADLVEDLGLGDTRRGVWAPGEFARQVHNRVEGKTLGIPGLDALFGGARHGGQHPECAGSYTGQQGFAAVRSVHHVP